MHIPHFLMPPLMSNKGNYIVSLGDVVRWLAAKAEALGVEIYPGFPAAEILVDSEGTVTGVATGDLGVGRDGSPKDEFVRGMALHGKYTLFAEGARGSLSKKLIAMFDLDVDAEPQKFGIGLKELWQVPAGESTGRASFSIRWAGRWTTAQAAARSCTTTARTSSPSVSSFTSTTRTPISIPSRNSSGSRRTPPSRRSWKAASASAMARARSPRAAGNRSRSSPSQAARCIGCSAGFMNVPRIKGSHNAMLSGKFAAEAAFEAIEAGRGGDELAAYESAVRTGVHRARPQAGTQCEAASVAVRHRAGNRGLSGMDMWLNTISTALTPTLKHGKPDYAALKPAENFKPIDYPKPDGKLTFDIPSSLFLSGTNHEEDQPVHLAAEGPERSAPRQSASSIAEPAQRYCPAAVYEVIEEGGAPRFQINAQNCLHCKTCDIKDPAQNINWVRRRAAAGRITRGCRTGIPRAGSGGPFLPAVPLYLKIACESR